MSVLLPLLISVPLLGAVASFAFRSWSRLSWSVTTLVLAGQTTLAIVLVVAIAQQGTLRYVVGGLPAAIGIGLLADAVTAAFVLLVAVSALAFFVTVRKDGSSVSDGLWLLLVAGLTGVTVTADVFNLYVFLEISGLAAYALVATGRGAAAALAAFRYLLVGTVGATLYLLGVGYLYVATGTLSMAVLRDVLPTVGYGSPLVIASFALIAVGLAVKLALFPLHTWKPAAYATSPVRVSALLATLVSTIAGYALVRLTFDVFTVGFLREVPVARTGLLVLGSASVVAGGLLTLRQTEMRRLLAYSSVLQFGLITVAVGVATPASVTGALLLLLGHAISKGGLFVAVGALARDHSVETVDDYAGLVRDAPTVTLAFSVVFVSLVGLPPTIGFAGKWYIALGALAGELWSVTALVVGSTLLSILYIGRVVETMVFDEPISSATGPSKPGHESTPQVTADGGRLAIRWWDDLPFALLVAVAIAVIVLGLGSSSLAAWFAPVVEGWL